MEPEVRMTTFEPGASPTREQNIAMMREQFEKLMVRGGGAVAMVLTVEFASGGAATAAVGSKIGLEILAELGVDQVRDMLARASCSGENG